MTMTARAEKLLDTLEWIDEDVETIEGFPEHLRWPSVLKVLRRRRLETVAELEELVPSAMIGAGVL